MTKKIIFVLLSIPLLMILFAPSLQADKSPAVKALGSEKAAMHLRTHEGAFTDNIPEMPALYNRDDEHIFCCGNRVSMWDTPQKGSGSGLLYPGSKLGYIGEKTEFELLNVCSYKKKYYANVRLFKDGLFIYSGWVSADYIACSCRQYDDFEEVYEHETISLVYSLH